MKFFGLLSAVIVTCAYGEDNSYSRRRAAPVSKSIAQTAIDTPELSSLVGALQQANLVDALSGAGSYTVFAPTNDAFAAIQETVAGLTTQQLTEVLQYHVIQNVVAKSTDLSNGEVLNPLFLHHSLSVDLSNGVQIRGETNTVTVTTADVLCSNGVVHIVNAVLIPNSLRTIVDLAVGTPELSSLVGALQTANLVNALSGPGPFTVFAPTNDAFAAISSVVDGLTVDQLTKVLENHVISGVSAKAADLSNGQVLSSLFHESTVSIHRENYGGLQIEAEAATVRVTVRDQVCNNGVVHIVNAVLLPRYQTIVEAALAQPSLSTLVGALTTANLVDTLSGPGTFTVFAPTNDAFASISSIVDGLTTEQLTDVLLAHVLGSEVGYQPSNPKIPRFPGSSARTPYETLFESHSVTILGRFYAGDARNGAKFKVISETVTAFVKVADVLCTNGIVHIVDTVLVPNVPLATIAATAASWFGGAAEDVKLSAFTGALAQANLVAPLSGDGPLTVFAPTDAAFAAISEIVGSLSMEQLVEILEYHVISGVAAKAADLTNGEVLQPLFAGHALTVDLGRRAGQRRGAVNIQAEGNLVSVKRTDRLCTNGVIHVVDAVLLPNIPLTTMNIVQTAQSVPDLSSLVDAVVATNLAGTLSGPGSFTVFAPTNAAFAAIASLGLSTKQLKDVLLYHVLNEEFKSTDLTNGGVLLPLFTGHGLTVDLTNGVKIMAEENSVMVTTADVACTNGVVHIVDAVLIPNRLAVSEVV